MKKIHLLVVVYAMIAATLILAKTTVAQSGATPSTSAKDTAVPRVLQQPEDQSVHLGAPAVFTVTAENGRLAYQWLHNGNIMGGQTKPTLTIGKVQLNDVGFYACNVKNDSQNTLTRTAELTAFENHVDPATGIDPLTLYAMPTGTGGSNGVCPGHYTGLASYTKTIAQGWGWAPDTNTTVFTATDTNRTNTKVEYIGKSGDRNCAQTTVTIPNPPVSTVYRFTVYFTNNVPTNTYALTLTGFNP